MKNTISQNISAHNKIYKLYNLKHNEIYNKVEQDRLKKIISKLVSKSSNDKPNVLDVGAGTGNLSLKFLDKNSKVTACDVSIKSLELLKRLSNNNSDLKIKLLTNNNLPFKDGVFDIVGTYSVLHHIPNYLYTIEEMIRITKKGGIVYIDHESNRNRWNPDGFLKDYYNKTKHTKKDHLMKLIKTKELFTVGFIKTLFIKLFINKKYEREGDIHVWADDHIEWDKIKKVFGKNNCKIIEEENYLLYRPKGKKKLYDKYKKLTTDTKYIIFQKIK